MNIILKKGDSANMLKSIPSKSVDLVVTSPPYDNLRTYGGVADSWNFEKFKAIANELARMLKDGGVIVWNVCDQCVKGSYTCNSYRQVLYFTEKLGLKLNDEIVWHKSNPMMNNRRKRYQAAHESLYVFTKGKLETFNPIMRECKNGGKQYKKTFISNTGKGYTSYKEGLTNKEAVDYNVWTIPTATSKESTYISKDGRKIHHTAVFPKELAEKVIMTWSNEGDTVLDPFLGSGTSGIAAVELGRSFIGCELNEDYFTMASERIGCVAEGLGISLDTKTSNDVKPFPTVKKAANRKYSTAKSDRAENDYYATDPLAAQLLLQNEGFSHNVWECASGENHLADVFRHYGYYVRTSDIVKRTQTTEVLDFLDCNVECWNGDIITNPPYSHSQEFVEKALSVISNGHKVAMFLRLQFLEGICRYKLFKENPPKVVYVSAKRIRCGKDGDFNTSSSGINAYAWYVWEKGYKGETSVKWINHGESVNEEKIRANRKSMEVKPLVLCDSDLLSERFKMKVVDKKGKKHNLNIQRVECAVYEKLFSRYDYVGGKPINKAAMCFLVTTSKGQPLGFLGFLNHTFKGCSNGMKVSRFVLFPQFRGKGLALPILSRTCGILKSRGYRVFINTESTKLGERLMASCNYRSTTFNCVNRAIRKDDRYKGRRSGKAFRLEYCGNSVYGYGMMIGKLADMRARKLNCRVKRKQPFAPTSHNHLTFYGCSIVPLYVDSRNGMCSESHIAWCQTPQYMSRGSPFGMSG